MTIETLRQGGPVHWGVMLAQGWKGELAEAGNAGSWAVARGWAQRAENLGFHGLWVFDHFQPYPARDDSTVLEAWTTLAALSQVTSRIAIGTLVSCASYRYPKITVRMAENLHRVSGGRFCLGVGAGWDQPEFGFLGVPFGAAAERSARLVATLAACSKAWSVPGSGVAASVGERPALLVGGDGERRTLPAAVAYADVVNWQVGVRGFAHKSGVARGLCDAAGRDPDSLRRTHACNFLLFGSDREFARWRQNGERGMSAEEVYAYIRRRGALYGTASAIEETIEEFLDLGCGGFMIFCNSAPSMGSLEELVSLPSVSRALAER